MTKSTKAVNINNMTVTELKKHLASVKREAKAAITETAEVARLTTQISLEQSEAIQVGRANLVNRQHTTNTLEKALETCVEIVDENPLMNKKTKANRVFNGSFRFNYGEQINLVYQLVTGITFSAKEHREEMLETLGLSAEVLGAIYESFGSPSYYSRNNHMVVPARMYDTEGVREGLQLVMVELGIDIDISKITDSELELEFIKAETKASVDMKAADEAVQALTRATGSL